jgi:hypothetical protein
MERKNVLENQRLTDLNPSILLSLTSSTSCEIEHLYSTLGSVHVASTASQILQRQIQQMPKDQKEGEKSETRRKMHKFLILGFFLFVSYASEKRINMIGRSGEEQGHALLFSTPVSQLHVCFFEVKLQDPWFSNHVTCHAGELFVASFIFGLDFFPWQGKVSHIRGLGTTFAIRPFT